MAQEDTVLFPSDGIDPNKKSQLGEFLNLIGKGIFDKYRRGSTYYGATDVSRLTEIRNYSNGQQSAAKYQEIWADAGDERTAQQGTQIPSPLNSRVGRRGFQNMSWEIFSLAPELKRVMMSRYLSADWLPFMVPDCLWG